MNKCIMKHFILALCGVGIASNAFGAKHFDCNGNGWEYWNVNPEFRFLAGAFSGTWEARIQSAADEFNLIGDVARTITFGADVNTVSPTNYISEIYTDNLDPGVHAFSFKNTATSCLGGTSILQEAQIVFDLDEPFTVTLFDENQPTTQAVKNVAMHEFGHAMGLAHNPNVLAVMKNTYGDGAHFGVNRQTYHSDDKEGFRQIYGDGTTELNVAGGYWWVKAGSGELDTKKFNLMTSYNGFELPNGSKNNAPNTIYKGTGYRLPYHIENHSTSTQDVRARFYASLDTTIDTGDVYLGHVLYTMGKATEKTGSRWFSLPSSLSGGGTGYFFRYIVDKPYNSAPDLISGDEVIRYARGHLVQ